MKHLLLIIFLFALFISNAQTNAKSTTYTYIQTIDSMDVVAPDIRLAPWYGQISLGQANVDTIRVIMIIGQIRTSTTEFNEAQLRWKKGYFINSKAMYLDDKKKPINTNLYRVFSTFPWW